MSFVSITSEQQSQEKGHKDQDVSEPGSKGPRQLTQQLEASCFIKLSSSTKAWYVVFLLFLSKGESSASVVLRAGLGTREAEGLPPPLMAGVSIKEVEMGRLWPYIVCSF